MTSHSHDPIDPRRTRFLRIASVLLALISTVAFFCGNARADTEAPREVRAAVAANFTAAMKELAPAFAAASGYTVVASYGASGQLFAQIGNGAPFDVMLGADTQYTGQLVDTGLAVAPSRFIYARGRLALWSSEPGVVDANGDVLKKGEFERIAIANPKLAPYGRAAEQTLEALGVLDNVRTRFVTGENIGQTHQFVASGSVPLGFVALSQVLALPEAKRGSYWLVPASLHERLDQEAVLLTSARADVAAQAFLAWLKGPEARRIIARYGYEAATE